jgi:DNA-binding beta-propeller fold protein YncE
LSTSYDPNVGSELLGYRIEEMIGRGGMGVVFRALDMRLKRNVALKLLAPEFAADDRFRERFLRESELAASLDHPNVIPIYAAGEAEGRLFIAMRYVQGGDLRDVLLAGPLEPKLALEFCSQVADALDAAHERGLVHRDVKPSNVLLDGQRHVYLADFGLTRRIGGGDASGADALRSLGTIDYIAPEQIRGDEIDGRADLYSLGCLVYECLTGEPPFRRPSDLAVAFAHLEEEPLAPPGLEELVKKALAKVPEDRYSSGHELVNAARAALGLDSPQRRRLPLFVAGLVLALAIAGSLSFLLTRGGGTAATLTGRLLRIDPQANQVTNTIDVGSDPNAVTFGDRDQHVWVSTRKESSIWRIDPERFTATHFPANGDPTGVAVNRGIVYIPKLLGGVTVLNAASGTQLYVIPTSPEDGYGGPITSSGRGVWFAEELTEVGRALRLGAASSFAGAPTRKVWIRDPRPLNEARVRFDFAGLAAGFGAIWVAGDAIDRRVFRIDPGTKRVTRIQLPSPPGGVATGHGTVWVTGQIADVVWRIDPERNRIVQTIHVGRDPTGIAVSHGSVWVANTLDNSVSRIDPASQQVTTIDLKASPTSVTVAPDGAVWVAADAG